MPLLTLNADCYSIVQQGSAVQFPTARSSLQDCLQRASEADSQLLDEQGKVMKLEVTVAEQQEQLSRMEDLEKELNHHR